MLINYSSDSNHSSILTVLVVVAFTKKSIKKKAMIASKANAQTSTEYCSVRMRIILILSFVYMLSHKESKSTKSRLLLGMSIMNTFKLYE